MKKIDFIHIGYHRTGTTWLQQHVFPQCKGLTIISNEGLSGNMFKDHYAMPKILKARHPEAKIIITLRSQFTIIPSMYSYLYIKSGGTMTYRQYLDTVVFNDKFNYYRLVSAYLDVYDTRDVLVNCYEDLNIWPDATAQNPEAFNPASHFMPASQKQDKKGVKNLYLQNLLEFLGLPDIEIRGSGDEFRNARHNLIVSEFRRLANRVTKNAKTRAVFTRIVSNLFGWVAVSGYKTLQSEIAISQEFMRSNGDLLSLGINPFDNHRKIIDYP